MEIVFSDHCLEKMGKRKIPRVFVVRTVNYPDIIKPSYSFREERYKRFRNYFMKVICIKRGDKMVVITAHWVAKIKQI